MLKVRLLPGCQAAPTVATEGSAGLDLYSAEKVVLRSGDSELVKTGISVQIPEGFVGLVCSRSGLAAKYGIFVLNSPGVIDSDYRGEVGVLLHKTDPPEGIPKTKVLPTGTRIAQMVVVPCLALSGDAIEYTTDPLEDTVRGTGGWGSTGE